MVDFVLLRHAHAGEKHTWQGRDEHRPLSRRGQREARAVVDLLRPIPLARILTSPYVRCEQTVEPVAADRGLPVQRCSALAVGASPFDLLAVLTQDDSGDAVLCTHGEVIRVLFEAWRRQGRTTLPGPDDCTAKGGAWIIRGYPDREATARYVAVPGSGEQNPLSPGRPTPGHRR
ncbi:MULTISPECIES: SixA phosphatase family protein [unclassified Frankia]